MNDGGSGPGLRRRLTATQLLLAGIGASIGSGIFIVTGQAAAVHAGPAVALSFVLSGIACACAALCYAEFAAMLPRSGSAYTYARASLGPGIAWLIFWSLILEYLLAAAAAAAGWSGYFVGLLSSHGMVIPATLTQPPLAYRDGAWQATGSLVDLPAVTIIGVSTLVLLRGIAASAFVNALIVALKLGVILLVIGIAAFYVQPAHWVPFVPPNSGVSGAFGWSGVFAGAGIVFFSYLGFDAVSTLAQECRNPQRDVPIGLLGTVFVCTILYVAMSLVLTGIVPYASLNVTNPVAVALRAASPALNWLADAASVAAIAGMSSVILVVIMAQARILYAVAGDGLLPAVFARIHPQHQVPSFSTVLVGGIALLMAAFVPVNVLLSMISVGTLLAFSVVCLAVVVLRRTQPELPRPFRVPISPLVPLLGFVVCAYLLGSLLIDAWLRMGVWLVTGGLVYALYGRSRIVAIRRP
jgi:APA family basic amino acid/polyamine antiporter